MNKDLLIPAMKEKLQSMGFTEATLRTDRGCITVDVRWELPKNSVDCGSVHSNTGNYIITCGVCCNTGCAVCLLPCGHILCSKCAKQLQRCPFCRWQVTSKQNVFSP